MSRLKSKDGLNFEASLKKLEAIVRRLEDEQAPLEESLRLFAEGKELAKICEAELSEAENRVRQLIEDDKGGVKDAPLKLASSAGAPDEADEADEGAGDAEKPSASPQPGGGAVDDLPV